MDAKDIIATHIYKNLNNDINENYFIPLMHKMKNAINDYKMNNKNCLKFYIITLENMIEFIEYFGINSNFEIK